MSINVSVPRVGKLYAHITRRLRLAVLVCWPLWLWQSTKVTKGPLHMRSVHIARVIRPCSLRMVLWSDHAICWLAPSRPLRLDLLTCVYSDVTCRIYHAETGWGSLSFVKHRLQWVLLRVFFTAAYGLFTVVDAEQHVVFVKSPLVLFLSAVRYQS